MINEMKTENLSGYSKSSDQSLIIKFTGIIDHYSTQQATSFLIGQIDSVKSIKYVVVDLENVNYMSSVAIGMLTQCLKKLKEKNKEMYLLKMQPKVFDVLRLLGFDKFFNVIFDINSIPDNSVEEVEAIFPSIIACPICNKRYRIQKHGRYRCKNCDNYFIVNIAGSIQIA